MLDRIALVLCVIGGVNWGLVGLFKFDIVAFIFGSAEVFMARLLYILIAASAIWCVSLLFKENYMVARRRVEQYK